jgi:hypothetical protein
MVCPRQGALKECIFIEVKVLGESICVADFNPYCTGSISGKMNYAGYWRYLRVNDFWFGRNLIIASCNVQVFVETFFLAIEGDGDDLEHLLHIGLMYGGSGVRTLQKTLIP